MPPHTNQTPEQYNKVRRERKRIVEFEGGLPLVCVWTERQNRITLRHGTQGLMSVKQPMNEWQFEMCTRTRRASQYMPAELPSEAEGDNRRDS
jgi:hypothetical protein